MDCEMQVDNYQSKILFLIRSASSLAQKLRWLSKYSIAMSFYKV